jgi:phosphoglycolate phosphatase-like HAD superfamily hydrolase
LAGFAILGMFYIPPENLVIMLDKYKVLLWDFDGVIMDSNPVRTYGFEEVLKGYPAEQLNELITYHMQNGGLPRYDKFRYFFEKIRGEQVSEQEIARLSARFSEIMLGRLLDRSLLIPDSVAFIKANYTNFIMHIVSGSDQTELRTICAHLGLTQYFVSVVGSPVLKPLLTRQILQTYNYNKCEVAFIGDSVNDYNAAVENGIDFYGYNNKRLLNLSKLYIKKFM